MAQGHENKGNKTRKKKEIKDNKQRQNLGENYREKTAKMGGGHFHTDPARQNRQWLEPRLPSINRECKQRRRRR